MRQLLADTSVWRRYLAGRSEARAIGGLLEEEGLLLVHPWIIAELILGGLAASTEALLGRLPAAPVVPDAEVLAFVRTHRLQRSGVGWVDVHLLASALVSGSLLWTFDKDLARAAIQLNAGYRVR